jgi:hypothetical protein
MPNALADMFRGVYNAMIPAPARAYGEFMMGSNAPITERDMTPEMMAEIRRQFEDKRQRDEAEAARLRGRLDMSREEYAKYPEVDPIAQQSGYEGTLSYDKAMELYRQQLSQYKPGRTAISKYDPKFTNVDTAMPSPYDPGYQVATTLGRYNVVQTPQGPVALDTYNFDNFQGNGLLSTPGLVGRLNVLANMVRPGASRPVRINLNGK